MAIRELQTAAARVVSIVHPTERDVTHLASRFGLHPHDAEALLAVPAEPAIKHFRDYTLISTLWPMYDQTEKTLKTNEVTYIISPTDLAIIDQIGVTPIQSWIDNLMVPNQTHWQDRPDELLAAVSLQLARWSELQVQTYLRDLATSIDNHEARQLANGLDRLSAGLEDWAARLSKPAGNESLSTLQVAIHRIRYQAQQLRTINRPATRPVQTPWAAPLTPGLVKGYAWASAAVAIVMLGWMIGK